MYDQILFPTDGSDPAAAAFEYALDVAEAHAATIHVLSVADTGRDSVTRIGGDVIDVLERESEKTVEQTAARANERGVETVTAVLQGDPSQTIVEYATANVDLVAMPTHGRSGLERFLLGSVTERVINAVDLPVLALNPDVGSHSYPPHDVLVPTDGSPGADRALADGIALASEAGATLHVLHVVETGTLGVDARSVLREGDLSETGEKIVADAAARAEATGLDSVSEVVSGRAYRSILAYVDDHDVDFVAVGTTGTTDFSRRLLGSVADKLVRTAPVPLLLAGRDGDEE